MKHSELVPVEDLSKPDSQTYYISTNAWCSSTTTKLRVVYDDSAKSTSGHSLNVLLSGPVLYPLLTDILNKIS